MSTFSFNIDNRESQERTRCEEGSLQKAQERMPETKAVDCRIPTSDQGWSQWFTQGSNQQVFFHFAVKINEGLFLVIWDECLDFQ